MKRVISVNVHWLMTMHTSVGAMTDNRLLHSKCLDAAPTMISAAAVSIR